MKKIIFLLSVFLVLFAVTLSAVPVSFQQAEQTAKLKLQIEDKNDFIIKDFYELKGNDDSILAYVYHLDPQGFIIITTDTDIVPVLGYSFLNNFPEVEEGEWTIGNHYV
ncbi:MAG: Spi family protease inhibitor, partial [Candidatus Celaenobacter antarcticus]|nr:Spi family protease inhibitor [Candidatus Celaenobacter antarcticus]